MKRLEAELWKRKAKFAEQETEIKQLKENSVKQLDAALSSLRSEAQFEVQKLQSELSEENRRLEVMSALNENVEVAIQTKQLSMLNSATQTEQVPQAEVGTQTVQAGQIEVAIQSEQVGHSVVSTQTDHLTQSEVTTQTEQAREPEVATQTVRGTHRKLTVLPRAADFVLIK